MGLRKEYVVTNISSSPDGSPYVFVTLKDPKETGGPQAQPVIVSDAESMNDMVRNIGRMMTAQMTGGFTTVIKMQLNEYDNMDVKVGDKLSLTIDKVQFTPT